MIQLQTTEAFPEEDGDYVILWSFVPVTTNVRSLRFTIHGGEPISFYDPTCGEMRNFEDCTNLVKRAVRGDAGYNHAYIRFYQ